MENGSILQKAVYAGVGLASVTAEKIEETINDLVDKGKISDGEGKKIVEDFFKNTEAKSAEFETKLKKVVENVVSKFDFLKRDDVESLKKRIEELEVELAKRSDAKKSTAAKATV